MRGPPSSRDEAAICAEPRRSPPSLTGVSSMKIAPLCVERDLDRLDLLIERAGLAVGQVDRHAGDEQRRGDHEDDQQHQHDVDHRRDVDLRHRRPPSAPSRPEDRSHRHAQPSCSSSRLKRAVEAVGEALQPRLEPVDAVGQAVVGDHRRDRGEQAERGREQRLGDAGRDHREAGILGAGNVAEAAHDAPAPCRTGRRTARPSRSWRGC